MSDAYETFSRQLCGTLAGEDKLLRKHPGHECKLQISKDNGEQVELDLTPFIATPRSVSANSIFSRVVDVASLFLAYDLARKSILFEKEVAGAYKNVSDYADLYLEKLFSDARKHLTDNQAVTIGRWVCDLDIYVAVKAVESLLNSRADIGLLMLSEQRGWTIHFDHLAIRCGSSANRDAERIVELLCNEHAYVASQIASEKYYQFPEGWNAYPLYKMLENGQVLRIFVDQSDAAHSEQIIQHWNHVYGYTAHHLAMRATQLIDGQRVAISLGDVIQALQEAGIDSMTPTGQYTRGLLEQVFTRPEKNDEIPDEIVHSMSSVDGLQAKIGNAKLLELVSRREMPAERIEAYFALYGLRYDVSNPLHSAPVYQYFLPAQAAHVIKTSIEFDN